MKRWRSRWLGLVAGAVGIFVALPSTAAPVVEGQRKVALRQRVHNGAFIDLGTRDGVRAGDVLPVFRAGKEVARCVVRELSSSHAACEATGLLDGDQILAPKLMPRLVAKERLRSVQPPPARAKPSAPTKEQRSALRAARQPLARFVSRPRRQPIFPSRAAEGRRYRVSVGHQAAGSLGRASRARIQIPRRGIFEQIEAGFSVAEDRLWPGLLLTARARLQTQMVSSSKARFRLPYGVSPQLGELSARYAPAFVPALLQVGRFRPGRVPGATTIDGVLLGTRFFEERVQAGVFLGAIPDPVSLAPTPLRGTVAGYASGFFRPWGKFELAGDGRAAFRWRPDGAIRLEAEGRTHVALWSWLRVGASGRGGTADPIGIGAQLDSLRGFVDGAVWRLNVGAAYRYQASSGFDLDGGSAFVSLVESAQPFLGPLGADLQQVLAGPVPAPLVASHHLNGFARYQTLSWLEVAMESYAASSLDFAQRRWTLGPSASFVNLLGRGNQIRIGGQVEFGTMPGRQIFAEARLRAVRGLWFFSRASLQETGAIVEPMRNASLSARGRWDLFPWLALEGQFYSATGLPGPRIVSHDASPFLQFQIRAELLL